MYYRRKKRQTGRWQRKDGWVDRIIVSPGTYEKIYQQNGALIRQATVLPPELGGGGFGRILLEFNAPVAGILRSNRKADEQADQTRYR